MIRKKLQIIPIILLSLLCSSCVSVGEIHAYGLPDGPRFAENFAEKKIPPKDELTVVTLNVKFCFLPNAVIKLLNEDENLAGADVICMQEMCRETTQKIAEALNYNYVYYPSAIHPGTGVDYGVAILSKWPIEEDKKIILPHSEKDRYSKMPKTAVGVKLRVGNKRIAVFSAHLNAMISTRYRVGQIQAMLDAIPAGCDSCIVTGDFNTYTHAQIEAIAGLLEDSGFVYASEDAGWTYKHWYLLNKKSVLDHIFVRGFDVVDSGTSVVRVSDHRGVWVDLKLN
ncbi:MAG: endonuclease/exonuclease/phosphatase family protein [Candidatus Omnitrophota bacterium]